MSEGQPPKPSVHEIERLVAQQVSRNIPIDERENLLWQLDASRQEIESLLAVVSPEREIYTGWRRKEILAHLTGWEDGSLKSVQAMLAGEPPSVPAAFRGPDYYNEQSVTERVELTYEQIVREWQLTRQQFSDLIKGMNVTQFATKLIFPWGAEGTVADAILGLLYHEQEHVNQIRDRLEE